VAERGRPGNPLGTVAQQLLPAERVAPAADHLTADADDTLILLFMCCHPALSPAAQIALTLRAVGGLTTLEIARAFLVPEATMTRRITRAKQTIKDSGVPFRMPASAELGERLSAVLHVLYLIFNEGYASASGTNLYRSDLSLESIRLCRAVHQLLPNDPEVTGLLALMLLTDARRAARAGRSGELIPMAAQDRTLWNAAYIAEGVQLVTEALQRAKPGPYQLQAAIATVHAEAPSMDATDWPQIVALYEVLLQTSSNPVVELNHAVAVGMAQGPQAGLSLIMCGIQLATFVVASSPALSASNARTTRRNATELGSHLGIAVPQSAIAGTPAAARLSASIGASTITTSD
jgi:predicted RNA polymerase sigma factor